MKHIIIPDLHGRNFWIDPVLDNINKVDTHIVFLGDYLDPYESFENITPKQALDKFNLLLEIIQDANNVTLLIGNHDYEYWPEMLDYYSDRRDDQNKKIISDIFKNNLHRFQLAYEYDKYLFTHAGVLEKWWELDEPINAENINKLIDKPLKLSQVPWERGGKALYGSCIWADVSEHYFQTLPNYYQIFGHTWQYYTNKPIITPYFAMLDCKKVFTLDSESGQIDEYYQKNE